MEILVIFILIFIKTTVISASAAHIDAKRLYEDLKTNSNRLIRPVGNNTDKLTVKMGLKLTQLLDVDEKNQIMTTNVWLRQEWTDYKLRWDPKRYGGIEVVYVPSSNIWIPDIVLYNKFVQCRKPVVVFYVSPCSHVCSLLYIQIAFEYFLTSNYLSADGHYEVTLMTKATLHYDGRVIWEPPVIYKSSCTINVEFFPFDEQHCTMKFGSWTYDGFQVDLTHINQPRNAQGEQISNVIPIGIDLRDFYPSVEWDIMSVPAKRNEKHYPCCPEPYPDITFNITLRRKTLFYTVNLIIPCVGISFLTVLTFYLPSDSGEKIALCVNILLSLTVFFLLLSELIPPTSLVVPLIGKYLLFTMVLVTLSILVTIVVLNVHFRSSTTHSMPSWVRRVFLHVLPRILFLRQPNFANTAEFWKQCEEDVHQLRVCVSEVTQNEYAEVFNLTERRKDFRRRRDKCHTVDIEQGAARGNRRPASRTRIERKKEKQYPIEIREAIQGVINVCEHMKEENDEKMVREEWKYVALVIDRLFLWIFTTACICGSAGIILQAPSFYDTNTPIDTLISKKFAKV